MSEYWGGSRYGRRGVSPAPGRWSDDSRKKLGNGLADCGRSPCSTAIPGCLLDIVAMVASRLQARNPPPDPANQVSGELGSTLIGPILAASKDREWVRRAEPAPTMRGLQPRGEANKRGITPNQVERENWGKRELGSIGTAGENHPALDRSTAQPLPRSPFPARLFGSNLNNSPVKGSLAYPGGRASLSGPSECV